MAQAQLKAARTRALSKATKYLRASDPRLDAIIRAVGKCELHPDRSVTPFTALARAIVYQQLHGRAAATIWARVLMATTSSKRAKQITPAGVLAVPRAKLHAAGLSQNKLAAIIDLAEHATRGLVPTWKKLELMTDEEIVALLTKVRGIGPWTVEMLLIFRLGRLDVLPVSDFGVRKGFGIVTRKAAPDARALSAHGEVWRPYRSVASWYLWRAADGDAAP